MKILRMEQHLPDGETNPEWYAVRAGKFTGSDIYVFMPVLKKGELSDTAETKLYERALAEIELPEPISQTPAMMRGIELEPIARDLYCLETMAKVEEVGFVDMEELRAGCSPDGCVFDDSGEKIKKIIEIKCPSAKNYLKMAKGKIPTQYVWQIQHNLFVTGADSCDFVVYHPAFKLSVQTVMPDPAMQKDLRAVLEILNKKYDEIEKDIKEFAKWTTTES